MIKKHWCKRLALSSLFIVTPLIILLALSMVQLDREIRTRIDKGWFLPPLEIYSRTEPLYSHQQRGENYLLTYIKNHRLRERKEDQSIRPGDYAFWTREFCQSSLMEELPINVNRCVVFLPGQAEKKTLPLMMAAFDSEGHVEGLYEGQPLRPVSQLNLGSTLFAQFYGDQPILRRLVPIGKIPLACLQAVTAIEDSRFLEHQGVSLLGIARAFLTNLRQGRVAEGGSTITQQLVKNYFLTSERTLKRKIKEMMMSLLLEARVNKDQILENYLNVIYMGQNGSFQVRGYGSAAPFYFAKPIENLDLAECALLAAIVNSPGRYNPFQHPEQAQARRQRVLKRMLELHMIEPDIFERAQGKGLPTWQTKIAPDPAPYFVQGILRRLKELRLDEIPGLRVYTSLSQGAQKLAQKSIEDGLERLEKHYKKIKKLKDQGEHLEAMMIAVDVPTGGLLALVGGRNYKLSQFNRALDAHRQVGSIMKPFVYLASLETTDKDGNPYHPLTSLEDKNFTHRYDHQKWSPRNFDGHFRGQVPLFYALTRSLNAATARLGLDVGLSNVVDLARRAGVVSDIKEMPSLSLGAYELYPWEVAQSYLTIARMGEKLPLHSISRVEDLEGEVLFETNAQPKTVIAPDVTGLMVGMLKENLHSGTGQSITSWRGFKNPAAGKTGTTSDTKDAWFAGFTPYVLAVVWVGYDNNLSHGLTGSSGAIPIWTQFMKDFASRFPPTDFPWPSGLKSYHLPAQELESLIEKLPPKENVLDAHLILRE